MALPDCTLEREDVGTTPGVPNRVPEGVMVPANTFLGAHQEFFESGRGQGGLLPSKASDRPLEI